MDELFRFFSPEARERRGRAAADLGLRLEKYVPPNLRPLVGLLAEGTPTMTLDRAGRASERMLAPDRTPMQRVGDFGEMLSETASIAAPMAVANRAGMPVAEAVQEGLLGLSVPAKSAGQAIVDRANQRGPVPTMYSNPLMSAPASIDDQVEAARQAVLNSPNDEKLFLEYKRLRRMRDEGSSALPQSTAPAPQEIDTSYRMEHQPVGPQDENPIRLDDLTKSTTGERAGYPEDFYGPQGMRFYAQPPSFPGDEYGMANQQSYRAIQAVRGDPDAEVTIYRGVPDEDNITSINPGDFITLSPKYAELHASSGYGPRGEDAGKVISQRVKVKDVYFAGDDVNEFGYFPSQPSPAQEVAGLLSSGRVDESIGGVLSDKYPDVAVDLFGDPGRGYELSRIVVPEGERNRGVGSKVMRDIVNMADAQGAKISLTPDSSFGGSKTRLKDFYKRFGFVENKGRNKDFSTRNTMYRDPQPQGLLGGAR